MRRGGSPPPRGGAPPPRPPRPRTSDPPMSDPRVSEEVATESARRLESVEGVTFISTLGGRNMKRFAFLIAVLALAGTALTTALAGTAAKKSICHRTSSSTNPYVKLTVSAKSLAAHLKHPADIYPVPKG